MTSRHLTWKDSAQVPRERTLTRPPRRWVRFQLLR